MWSTNSNKIICRYTNFNLFVLDYHPSKRNSIDNTKEIQVAIRGYQDGLTMLILTSSFTNVPLFQYSPFESEFYTQAYRDVLNHLSL